MEKPINTDDVVRLACIYESLERGKKELDKQFKDAKDKLSAALGGMTEVRIDDTTINIKRSELWQWDQEELADCQYECVQVKRSISKEDFNELSVREQAEIRHALTIKPGRQTIKITHEDSE